MAKTSGLGDNLYVGGYDLSGDIQALDSIHGGPAALDLTSIDKSAFVRTGGVRDGGISATSFFNSATGQAHPVLSALPTADVVVTYCRGTQVGAPAACVIGKQIGYDPTRDDAGNLTLKTEVQANGYGLEWGLQLTAGKQTDTSATDSEGLDNGDSTDFGAQAYLQVFSVTGTSCTVTIEDSSDDDTYSSLIAFTAATTRTTERKTVTGTVDDFVRISTSGTFTSCVFSVVFVRNNVAVTF